MEAARASLQRAGRRYILEADAVSELSKMQLDKLLKQCDQNAELESCGVQEEVLAEDHLQQ